MFIHTSVPLVLKISPFLFIIIFLLFEMPLYSFGSNGQSQLGHGHTDDLDHPVAVELPFPAIGARIELAFGGNHTLLLDTTTGILYGTGSNTNQQLSTDTSIAQIPKFTELITPEGKLVKYIGSLWDQSVIVTRDDCVYATNGAAGFTKLAKLDCVSGLWTGMAHAVVLCSDGVYGWGQSRKSQLGAELVAVRKVATPTKLSWPGMVSAACGRTFTAVLDGQGNVTIHGTIPGCSEQTPELKDVVSVYAGWSTLHTLGVDGFVRSLGNDSHGQLARLDSAVKCVAAGTEHGLALNDKHIIAWGWAEHGNCGPDRNSTGAKILCGYRGNSSRIRIWGGAASSWIWTDDEDELLLVLASS